MNDANEETPAWGAWTQKLLDWCLHAAIGDAGERPAVILELDGDGWWDIEARSFYDGHATSRAKDLEVAAQEAYERLTSHPERQLEAEIKSAAYAVSRVTNLPVAEAEQWLTQVRKERR